MNKAMLTASLSGGKLYICIGILLILWSTTSTEIDIFQFPKTTIIETTTKKCDQHATADIVVDKNNNNEMLLHITDDDSAFTKRSINNDDDDDSSRSSTNVDGTTRTTTTTTPLRNLRLVFLGDSVTRYQYLSLAYYIRYGYWYYDNTNIGMTYNNLMNAHSFHHPFHPNDDWNEFFLQSNRILHPYEICDCVRDSGISSSRNTATNSTNPNTTTTTGLLAERRYFYDHRTNNMLVYINMNGNEASPGSRGYYGRLLPETIFTANFSSMVGIVSGMEHFHHHSQNSDSSNNSNIDLENSNNDEKDLLNVEWEYFTWEDVIRYHVGLLDFNYNQPELALPLSDDDEVSLENPFTSSSTTIELPPKAYVLLNAGLHPHDFHNPNTRQNVVHALHDTRLYGTWKTTTYTKVHVLQEQVRTGKVNATLHPDEKVITELEIQQSLQHNVTANMISDTDMCHALLPHKCLNVSWILQLRSPISQYYTDNLHYMEPIYRIINEEYLQQLSLLSSPSSSYIPFDKSQIIVES